MGHLIQSSIDLLVTFATDWLMPSMLFLFLVAISTRVLIWHTLRRQEWFTREFQKRVHRLLDTEVPKEGSVSFYITLKKTLENTFYEIFKNRIIYKRRRPDKIASLYDRIFMIDSGVAWLIRDTLKRVKYLNRSDKPDFLQISKNIFQSNPYFKKLFGVIPVGELNETLNILPGIFIIGGIFGTFLGIMKALPELGGMDLADAEQTKMVMDGFLIKISFSMSTSLVGIILSVSVNMLNLILSPERVFVNLVDRFEDSLDTIWNLSSNNDLPVEALNEHRDALETLAEASVMEELERKTLSRDGHHKGQKDKDKQAS
ncbi:MAG: hypothetical protein KDD22_01850 [Bdellovibrionales bacterium]|nr:hypothetical protein [Bdellovibrionales bacterium]